MNDCIPSNTEAAEHRKDKSGTKDAMSLYKYMQKLTKTAYKLISFTKFHLEQGATIISKSVNGSILVSFTMKLILCIALLTSQ